jgi:hypothetical protein
VRPEVLLNARQATSVSVRLAPLLVSAVLPPGVETGAENSLVDLRKALDERPVLSSASGLRDFVESAGTMSAFPLVALGSPEKKTHIPTEAIVEGSGEILGKSLVSAVSDSKYPQSQEYFC